MPTAKKKTSAKKPAAKKPAAATKDLAAKKSPATKERRRAATETVPAVPKKTPSAKKPAAKAKAAAKKPAAKKPAAKKPATKVGPRADYGAPIDGFFAKQPPALRPIAEALRALVAEVAPDATACIKWGMPFFQVGDGMVCAIGGHRSHVNLILSGPPGTFADPDGLLSGDGKTGRHLKVTQLEELPRERVRGWLRAAVRQARG